MTRFNEWRLFGSSFCIRFTLWFRRSWIWLWFLIWSRVLCIFSGQN